MELFAGLIIKILPLYILVLLGYLAGTYFSVSKETVANLLIFFIAPFVVLSGVWMSPLNGSLIFLPLLFFALATVTSVAFYALGSAFWKGPEKNVLAFAAGSGNTGYFGLPLVVALFGEQYLSIAVLSTLGLIVYENTIGYYLIARGSFDSKQALMKLIALPAIYAFLLGVILLVQSVPIGESVTTLFANFRGAYSIFGLMLVGIGLSGVTRSNIDTPFVSLAFAAKFLMWPAVSSAAILLDMHTFHLLDPSAYPIVLALSIVPVASNTVAYATSLKAVPEKAAIAVVLSTVAALIYIPLFVAFVFPFIL